jgi:predicted amidohydrolase
MPESLNSFRIATAQYPIGFLEDWQTYQRHIEWWAQTAVDNGARMLLWPEYAAMELASLFGREVQQDLQLQLRAMQDLLGDFRKLYRALSSQHNVVIQPGTFPVRQFDGAYRNRAYLYTPAGEIGFQDKLQMTRFENEQWLIQGGDTIEVFSTELGKLGISVCYDSEFPLIARKQVEQGADLILVPSCTDTLAGYHRVKIGCQARALENQCYVVQACTVGTAEWSPAVDENCGAAAVYTPADHGFPADGVLVAGELNTPGWVYADIDTTAIATVRQNGQVFNYRDWDNQKKLI